jgi:hypothetical protein
MLSACGSHVHPVMRRPSCMSCGCRYSDPVMATGWHMVLGSLPLLAVSAAREGPELASKLSQLNGEPVTCRCCITFGTACAELERLVIVETVR